MIEKTPITTDEIKSYTLTELCKKDSTTIPTIKKWSIKDNYIKVQFENSKAKTACKAGLQKKPYTTKYIRVEDIKKVIEKRWWKLILKWEKSGWQKLQ